MKSNTEVLPIEKNNVVTAKCFLSVFRGSRFESQNGTTLNKFNLYPIFINFSTKGHDPFTRYVFVALKRGPGFEY